MDLNEKLSLKYSNNVPEGYDVSQIQYTYDFIYLVYKRDASIKGALRGVANEYGLSEDFLMNYLVKNKYLLSKSSPDEISAQLRSYNTKALKKILKKHGLKTSGKREKIEERLIEMGLFGNDYYLSYNSKRFYENKKRRIRIFENFLFDYYYFCEFNEYYMNNFQKKEDKIPVEFIKQHINKAIEDENHRMFTLNNQVMVEVFYNQKKCKRMLEYVLKNFCINLNPVWKADDLSGHGGIAEETYGNLMYLRSKIGKNRIISAYFVVWDSFNFEKFIVSKYTGYRCLKDLLNFKDYRKILSDLDEKYYSNTDLKIKTITQKTLFDF